DRTGAGFRERIPHPPSFDSLAKRTPAYSRERSEARVRLGALMQVNVTCVNHLDRAVVQHQAKRALGLQPSKPASDRLVAAHMDCEARSREMRAFLPGAGKRRSFARPPQCEQSGEAGGEQG